jgi:hypothetical protein
MTEQYLTNITVLNDIIIDYVRQLEHAEKFNKVLNELKKRKRRVIYRHKIRKVSNDNKNYYVERLMHFNPITRMTGYILTKCGEQLISRHRIRNIFGIIDNL